MPALAWIWPMYPKIFQWTWDGTTPKSAISHSRLCIPQMHPQINYTCSVGGKQTTCNCCYSFVFLQTVDRWRIGCNYTKKYLIDNNIYSEFFWHFIDDLDGLSKCLVSYVSCGLSWRYVEWTWSSVVEAVDFVGGWYGCIS